MQAAQPKAWESLAANHGARASDTLLDRLRAQLDQRGTLDVLRHGVELLGVRQPLESATLRQQAASNSKQQFAASPHLNAKLIDAIMGALDAHNAMSTQALNSPEIQRGLKDILLNHLDLYGRLRGAAEPSAT